MKRCGPDLIGPPIKIPRLEETPSYAGALLLPVELAQRILFEAVIDPLSISTRRNLGRFSLVSKSWQDFYSSQRVISALLNREHLLLKDLYSPAESPVQLPDFFERLYGKKPFHLNLEPLSTPLACLNMADLKGVRSDLIPEICSSVQAVTKSAKTGEYLFSQAVKLNHIGVPPPKDNFGTLFPSLKQINFWRHEQFFNFIEIQKIPETVETLHFYELLFFSKYPKNLKELYYCSTKTIRIWEINQLQALERLKIENVKGFPDNCHLELPSLVYLEIIQTQLTNLTLNTPKLESLTIDCPNLQNFPYPEAHFPSLRKLSMNSYRVFYPIDPRQFPLLEGVHKPKCNLQISFNL